MATRAFLFLTAIAAAFAAFFFSRNPQVVEKKEFVQGRNNTILFLSNDDFGLANVLVATTYSLLTEHKDLDIHYGTHSKFKRHIENINKFVEPKALSKPIKIHIFEGINWKTAVDKAIIKLGHYGHKTGIWGLRDFTRLMTTVMQPVEMDDYLITYRQCIDLIKHLDPAVVVVDPLFAPGIDAIRTCNRREVMLAPGALQDTMGQLQPRGEVLWKYPAYVNKLPHKPVA